jgi:hypothetical protein
MHRRKLVHRSAQKVDSPVFGHRGKELVVVRPFTSSGVPAPRSYLYVVLSGGVMSRTERRRNLPGR